MRAFARSLEISVVRPPVVYGPRDKELLPVLFRMARTGIRTSAPKDKRDYAYYRDQGWFESDYYYPTHLSPVKRSLGAFSDWLAAHTPMFEVARTGGEGEPSSLGTSPR